MSCFKLPTSLCKRIQSLLTRFWWDGCSEKKKMSWVSWKMMAKPKALGGLGFRDIQQFNDVLLCKIAWRIIRNPDSLLSKLLVSKYCVGTNFLDCELPLVVSHGWRGIIIGRDVIKRKASFAVGNGKTIKVWKDKWIPNTQLGRPMGPIPEHNENLMVCDLLTNDQKHWDNHKVDLLSPVLSANIKGIKFSTTRAEDRLFWEPTKSGEYTTKSGLFELAQLEQHSPLPMIVEHSTVLSEHTSHSIHDTGQVSILTDQGSCSTSHVLNFNWHSKVWNLRCAPKIKLFLWKLFHDVIPTGDTLHRHSLNLSTLYPHCGQEESTLHLLFLCDCARDVWARIQWKDNSRQVHADLYNSVMQMLMKETLPPYGLSHGPLTPWVLWGLWKRRNALVFQNRAFSSSETVEKAIVDARDWQLAQTLTPTAPSGPARNIAQPLSNLLNTTTTYINTDASWHDLHKVAGLGLVITNSHTARSLSHTQVMEFVYSPLVGEALAIQAAITQAIDMDLQDLQIFSDSKACVDAILRKENLPEIYGILQDIRTLSLSFNTLKISFIPRTSNEIADTLAKGALSDFLFMLSISS